MTLESGAFRLVTNISAQSYLSPSHPPRSAIAYSMLSQAHRTPEPERDR
jgi:hypothetical protein